jgi:hypothetical protein
MAYIGNTAETQGFIPAVDFFSGNGSTTAFTLSRPVASVAQVQATIENVPQNPGTAFTVSGNTITFDGAPASGTNNIYVYYTSPITQVIQPGQGTVGTAQIVDGAVTQAKLAAGAGSQWVTSGSNISYTTGSVGIGTSTIGSAGISLLASYNLGWSQGAGESVPNIFRQTSSAATVMANGYRFSTTSNGFASSFSSSYAKSAISCGTATGGITFYTDTAATVAAGTDVTPTERMRIDSSGNVGIGTASPSQRLDVANAMQISFGGSNTYCYFQSTSNYVGRATSGDMWLNAAGGQNINFGVAGAAIAAVQASGSNFQFNSGYGSVATAYGCRAWVNFNGTGTVAIRASGNVSSITDNGTGDYTANFTTAMPDANYAASGFAQAGGGYALRLSNVTQPSTSAIRFSTLDPGVAVSDSAVVYLSIHR